MEDIDIPDKAPPLTDELIEKAADLIINSKNAIVLTGAGISTESGIPDFRSPDTGIWTKIDPSDLNQIFTKAEVFWRLVRVLGKEMINAKPNKAHIGIHKLEELKLVKGLITQNIDGLHQEAGSPLPIELHGNATEFRCIACHGYFNAKKIIKRHKRKDDNILPSCPQCGAQLMLNVVLFNQPIDKASWYQSVAWAQKTDLMIIVGSSLLVAPANELPLYTLKYGGKLIIINKQPTDLDSKAELVLRGSAGEIIKKIYKIIKKKL